MTYQELYFSLINHKNKYISKEIAINFLCDYFSISKEYLLSNFSNEISKDISDLNVLVSRILNGEPYQYVFSKSYFLGNTYYVDKNVLIPRQETEQLVLDTYKKIHEIFGTKTISILEIGSGSGNIAISLKKLIPNATITSIDIANEAVEIAKKNSKSLNVDVNFIQKDVFKFDTQNMGVFDVIISNPPYIKSKDTVDAQTLEYEPHEALFANPQTKFYEKIIEISKTNLSKDGFIAFEIDEDMEKCLKPLIKSFPFYEFKTDIYGKLRFLYVYNKNMNLNSIKKSLVNHEVIAFPTDTVMGLGIIFDDEIAYKNLNRIKNRPNDKPYTLMVYSKDQIKEYAFINNNISRLIDNFLPGPLTLLLKSKEHVPSYVTHNSGIIGIRVAPNKEIAEIIKFVGKPLLVPSANKSGENPAINSDEVERVFKDELGYIVKGEASLGIPSTIVDLTKDKPVIVREGKITLKDIIDCWEEK